MDPRLKGCIKIIEAARGNKPLSRLEQEEFQAEFNHINANAVKNGISLDAPVKLEDGRTVTHLQKEIGAIYDIVAIRKSIIQDMAETAQQGNALMDLETRIANIRNSIATNERYEKHYRSATPAESGNRCHLSPLTFHWPSWHREQNHGRWSHPRR